MNTQAFTIETEEQEDGRWFAEVHDVPGVAAYGATEAEAVAGARAMLAKVFDLLYPN